MMKINERYFCGILVLLCVLTFANTITNEFVFDDVDFLIHWPLIHSFESIGLHFEGANPLGHQGVYRPLRGIIYTASYALFGDWMPGYHYQAILIHILCTVLLYLVARQLPLSRNVSRVAAVLFAVHPIHIEAITFITTSFDIFGIVFALTSMYLYLIQKKRWHLLVSYVFALMAFMTYEIALMLPVLMILVDWFRGSLSKRRVPKYVVYFILAVGFYVVRFAIDTYSRNVALSESLLLRIVLAIAVYATYFQLLLFPVGLRINHYVLDGIYSNYSFVHYLHWGVLSQPKVILSFVLLVVCAYSLFKFKDRVLWFAALWTIFALAPVSNLIPMSQVVAEKYTYLASFGTCIFLGYLFNGISQRFEKKTVVLVCLTMVMGATLMGITIDRNQDWKDDETLWKYELDNSAAFPMSHTNYAVKILDKGMYNEAIYHFNQSIRLDPTPFIPYSNIAEIYLRAGMYEEALEMLYLSHKINDDYPISHFKRGEIFYMLGSPDAAIVAYTQTIASDPTYLAAYNELIRVYIEKGETEKAIEVAKVANVIAPAESNYKSIIAGNFQIAPFSRPIPYMPPVDIHPPESIFRAALLSYEGPAENNSSG